MTDINIQTDKKRLEHAKAALYRQKSYENFRRIFLKDVWQTKKKNVAEDAFLSQKFDQKYFLEQ